MQSISAWETTASRYRVLSRDLRMSIWETVPLTILWVLLFATVALSIDVGVVRYGSASMSAIHNHGMDGKRKEIFAYGKCLCHAFNRM